MELLSDNGLMESTRSSFVFSERSIISMSLVFCNILLITYEKFQHEKSYFMHENEIFMGENEISMHENENFAQFFSRVKIPCKKLFSAQLPMNISGAKKS